MWREGAGSSFACYPEGESLELSCDGGDTTCNCACDHNVTVPNAIPFSAQCDAFCNRDEVCGASGSEFKCGTSSGSSTTYGGLGVAISAPHFVDHLISLLSSVDLKSCIEVDMCMERE